MPSFLQMQFYRLQAGAKSTNKAKTLEEKNLPWYQKKKSLTIVKTRKQTEHEKTLSSQAPLKFDTDG
jgi:hypothetical protein